MLLFFQCALGQCSCQTGIWYFFFFFFTFFSVQKRVFVSICDQCMPLPLVFPSSFRRQTPQRWLTIPKVAHRKQLFSKDFRLSSLSSVQFQIGENHYETGSNKIGYAFRLGNCGKCRDVRLDVCLSCVLREPDKMWEMGESKCCDDWLSIIPSLKRKVVKPKLGSLVISSKLS